MRVVCVYTSENQIAVRKHIPFGISYIATELRNSGHDTRLFVVTDQTDLSKSLRQIVTDFDPGLMCLTAVTTQIPLAMKTAETVKSIRRDIYVVVGGTHATLNPSDVISFPQVDAVCIGEGEGPVVQVADALDAGRRPSGIENFWFKRPGSKAIEKNPLAPFEEDLDSLPFVDRGMWQPWVANPRSSPAILLGRGCPNSCTYCSNHALRKLARGRYVRFRSVANIMLEIEELCQDSSVTEIYLEVETIGSNTKFAFELSAALEQFNKMRSKPVSFAVNLALSKRVCDKEVTKRLLEAFSRANICTLGIGLETGSDRIRNEVLQRPPYSNDDLREFCRSAKANGIRVVTYVMLGLPTETPAEWRETVELVRECDVDGVLLSIFYPYPGTELYDKALKQGLFKTDDLPEVRERTDTALDLPGFPSWRVRLEYVLFPFRFLKGRASLPRRLYWSFMNLSELSRMFGTLYYLLSKQSPLGWAMRGFFGTGEGIVKRR